MRDHILVILILTFLGYTGIDAQSQNFLVKPCQFSSGSTDEFSPVFYKGGVVFCSNRDINSLISYVNDQNKLFSIFLVTKKDSTKWKFPEILSEDLTSWFNDGPATFSKDGTTIYYSRNNSIKNSLRNISDTTNKLGIYTAELVNGVWTNIKPFQHNDPLYSFCTPALSKDGSRIYFSSDMPGGSGGMDLYYCDRVNDEWNKPVNIGSVINTKKNEAFPFVTEFGKLYFASDGHPGHGGKDIFYTQEINGEWLVPVCLDTSINSTADDFGIVFDSTLTGGYFSSNRLNTDDIFSFISAPVDFETCDTIIENKYCFTFYDERHIEFNDTIALTYIWDFGNGIKVKGAEANHCFPGPGKYLVKLSIIDDMTGENIASEVEYNVELENIKQAFIKSVDVGAVDSPVSFEAITTDLKGITATDYFWNFGDGFSPGAPITSQTFREPGEFIVKLGLLTGKDDNNAIQKICVMKKIKIH